MTTQLTGPRTSLDAIGQLVSKQISQHLPGAVQQGYQRQTGLNAIDQAQANIQRMQAEAQANGSSVDPFQIAMELTRAGAQNASLERALGPLMQTAMQQNKVNRAFPGQAPATGSPNAQPGAQPSASMAEGQTMGMENAPQQTPYVKPSPFNIMSKEQMNAEAERYAQAVNDPNGYNTRFNQLQAQNDAATTQRKDLEDAALKANVKPDELPRFMTVNSHLNPENPSQWALEGKRNYDKVKSNDDKLLRNFIPGLGSGLLGKNRKAALKRMEPTVQDQAARGLEQETRKLLADNFVSPTEIEELLHPLTPQKEKAIKSLPNGTFPAETGEQLSFFANPVKTPLGSYEEATERSPQKMQEMQNNLTDFFLKNVDDNTSLLVLRDKLWHDKDYDWRQIGPAIREAEKKGLKLNTAQYTEMSDIETQPPRQSLPDIFQDWDRVTQFFRGNK